MDFAQNGEGPARNLTGIVSVVLLHVLIVYALLTGLARKMVEVIQQPVMTRLIPEIIPKEKPPPPKPKPKLIKEAAAPKVKPPPPAYVPPPEVKVRAQAQKNTIAVVSREAPVSRELPPPTQVQPVAKAPPREREEEPAPKVAAKPTAATAVSSTCEKPEYPRQSLQDEEEGTVTLAFLISPGGKVVESRVDRSSGSRALDRAALNALSQCSFRPGTVDGKPHESWTKMQYVWRLE
ncbi:MAG: TonB family protein [Glaciimonas sp.]|nr:TonB family protein [Glaciimonas sp.]